MCIKNSLAPKNSPAPMPSAQKDISEFWLWFATFVAVTVVFIVGFVTAQPYTNL